MEPNFQNKIPVAQNGSFLLNFGPERFAYFFLEIHSKKFFQILQNDKAM